jgi:hypothetical protein
MFADLQTHAPTELPYTDAEVSMGAHVMLQFADLVSYPEKKRLTPPGQNLVTSRSLLSTEPMERRSLPTRKHKNQEKRRGEPGNVANHNALTRADGW